MNFTGISEKLQRSARFLDENSRGLYHKKFIKDTRRVGRQQETGVPRSWNRNDPGRV